MIQLALRRNHYSGAVFGALMFAAVFAGILMVPTGNRFWFFPLFFALLPLNLYSAFKRIQKRYSHFPIVLSKRQTEDNDNKTISYARVDRLIVRENTGRETDDPGLAQLYAILTHGDSPLLLHQNYLFRREIVLQVGTEISSELNVRMDNEL